MAFSQVILLNLYSAEITKGQNVIMPGFASYGWTAKMCRYVREAVPLPSVVDVAQLGRVRLSPSSPRN